MEKGEERTMKRVIYGRSEEKVRAKRRKERRNGWKREEEESTMKRVKAWT